MTPRVVLGERCILELEVLPLFLREELVGDTYQLTVERSIVNGTFTMARSSGAGVGWSNSDLRMGADFTDGSAQINTPFNWK